MDNKWEVYADVVGQLCQLVMELIEEKGSMGGPFAAQAMREGLLARYDAAAEPSPTAAPSPGLPPATLTVDPNPRGMEGEMASDLSTIALALVHLCNRLSLPYIGTLPEAMLVATALKLIRDKGYVQEG